MAAPEFALPEVSIVESVDLAASVDLRVAATELLFARFASVS